MKKDLQKGDLVVTLPRVGKIRSILGRLREGDLGVIVEADPKFDNMQVYGVLIDGEVYYLFEDEIEKVEKKC